ncbi:hypothetical protein [Mycobacterium marinum]|uniref:hypothetical protein n=1 Tax=Mycobacterium marinum TaxID=1781 RepID=UPI002359BB61|nr:hypothetical protein [Mycobacterium marinum]MDC8970839.1 hypothetical protein [Mycobacterium marinum]
MRPSENRAKLFVVSVRLLSDCLPSGDDPLPATYSVALGMSRLITKYEFGEIVTASPNLARASLGIGTGGSDAMWLTIPDTTIDAVQENLPQWQDLFADAAVRANAVQQAAEALVDSQRAELERRHEKLTEVNRWLASLREQPRPESN